MIGFPTTADLRRLPPGSDERVAALIFLRALGREIYGPCPQVRHRLGADAEATLEHFLDATAASTSATDWRMHLEFGSHCGFGDAALWEELCTAAVRRWVRTDVSVEAWVALRSRVLPGRVFVGQRARALEHGPRYLRGRCTRPDLRSTFAYQTGTADVVALGDRWVPYEPVLGAAAGRAAGA